MGLRGLLDIERHVDDVIFPLMDMCLITLAGWFSPSPAKNNFSIQSLF